MAFIWRDLISFGPKINISVLTKNLLTEFVFCLSMTDIGQRGHYWILYGTVGTLPGGHKILGWI
ncbi:MAG: hypothetical protein EBY35_09740 [Rhodobacteraceae bacterium]|nr:hypothetical protein [Paracoccaceae bacterium]